MSRRLGCSTTWYPSGPSPSSRTARYRGRRRAQNRARTARMQQRGSSLSVPLLFPGGLFLGGRSAAGIFVVCRIFGGRNLRRRRRRLDRNHRCRRFHIRRYLRCRGFGIFHPSLHRRKAFGGADGQHKRRTIPNAKETPNSTQCRLAHRCASTSSGASAGAFLVAAASNPHRGDRPANHRARDESKHVPQPLDHKIHAGFSLADHDFDAPVLCATLGRVIAGDRVIEPRPFTMS